MKPSTPALQHLIAWLYEAGEEDSVSLSPRSYHRKAQPEAAPQRTPPAAAQAAVVAHPQPSRHLPPAATPEPPNEVALSHLAAVKKASALAASCDTVEALEQAVRAFDGCALKKFATNTVFSDGSRQAKIMLIGEAPGASEDEQGIPFCGASGKLLDKMLAAIGLDRQSVYITNTLFWRPPGNRTPTREELEICEPFVKRHIELMKPSVLIFCGGTSATFLLRSKLGITRMRGKMHTYTTDESANLVIPVVVLFHPSYLLRTPAQKKFAWQDLLLLKEHIDTHNLLTK